jgi:hypothetical protein
MSDNPKILIDKMLKQADMPAMPGSINVKNRGLDFHVFDRNRFKQKISKLPDVVKESIQRQIADFDRAFKKFPAARSQDYSGMLRIAYAEDRLIGEKELGDLSREQPDLVNTANFVREYGIQLPSDSAGFSAGAKVDKGIGSNYWFSIFGYAYQDLASQGLEYHVAQKRNSIPRHIQENVTGKERPNSANGTFQVVPAGNGFTFGIVNENGVTNIFDPAVSSNTVIMRKFFNDPIIMNRSAVYVSPIDGFVPDEQAVQFQFNPESTFIKYVNNADAMIRNNEQQAKFIWGIFSDPNNGAFYIQKKQRYGAGGRPVIDKETGQKVERVIGDKIVLNFEQVSSLANKDTIGRVYSVTAQSEGEIFDKSEVASGYKYAYAIEDENTLQKIMNPRNREEFTYSVPALRQLKKWIDDRSSRYSFDEDGNAIQSSSGSHTALEGFVIYMAGPDFSIGYNPDQATALGKPDMTQYKDLPGGEVEDSTGSFLHVNRMSFVVVAKQISIPRMMASERYYENKFGQKKVILSPWREVRTGLPSLSAAVAEMKKIIVGQGGKIVEDDEGNIIEKDPLPNLSPDARGVQRADKVFDQFVGREPIQPIKKQPLMRPPVEDVGPDHPDAQASNLAKKIIRSFNNNV